MKDALDNLGKAALKLQRHLDHVAAVDTFEPCERERAELSPKGPKTTPERSTAAAVLETAAALNWNDGRICVRLGVDPRTVRAWRKGERQPSLTHLYLMRAYVAIARTCPGLGCHQPTSVAALRLPEARGDLHKAVSEARFGHEPDYPPDWRKGCPTSAHVGHCLVYVDGRVKRLTEPEQDCNVIAWRRLTEPSKSSEEVDECESR